VEVLKMRALISDFSFGSSIPGLVSNQGIVIEADTGADCSILCAVIRLNVVTCRIISRE
jgi:hypothetical protein